MLFELNGSDLFDIGYAMGMLLAKDPKAPWRDFRVFHHISKYKEYKDGCLMLSVEERDAWRMEISKLAAIEQGKIFLPYKVAQDWAAYWKGYFQDLAGWGPQSVMEMLSYGIRLCEASEKTGNPIEFHL